MFTDGQQPVTQPSQQTANQDATDGAKDESKFAAGDGSWNTGNQTGTSQNNTSQSLQGTLKKFDNWRKVLRTSSVRKRLLSDVDPDEILSRFHYMPLGDEQQIQCRQKLHGRTSGVEYFLDALGRLGEPSWPEDFCKALRENGQLYLVDLLEQEYQVVLEKKRRNMRDHLSDGINCARNMRRYRPSIPPEELKAILQYCDLWKSTVRHEKLLLRDNVNATDLSIHFPYMSNKVDEKVTATLKMSGTMKAMDVFVDDGLMYIGDQNWPNDLIFALRQVKQPHIAEALIQRFWELLEKGSGTRYKQLDMFMKENTSSWNNDFGAVHSSNIS